MGLWGALEGINCDCCVQAWSLLNLWSLRAWQMGRTGWWTFHIFIPSVHTKTAIFNCFCVKHHFSCELNHNNFIHTESFFPPSVVFQDNNYQKGGKKTRQSCWSISCFERISLCHRDKWAGTVALCANLHDVFRAVVHRAEGNKPGRHYGGNWCLSVSVLYRGHLAHSLEGLAAQLPQQLLVFSFPSPLGFFWTRCFKTC